MILAVITDLGLYSIQKKSFTLHIYLMIGIMRILRQRFNRFKRKECRK